MGHLKIQKIPKNWPIERKSTSFVIKPISKKGIPLVVVLRNLLKIVQTRKEVKKAIHNKLLLVNNRPVKDEKIGMTLFDTLSLLPSKTYYRLNISEKGKYILEKINEGESNKKIAKIIDKKILKKKKTQLNLNDGLNFLSEIKCNVNDSILINLKDKKIEKCIPLKEGSKVLIFAGKHAGEIGQIKEINKEKKIVLVEKIDEKIDEKINILIKQIIIIE